MLVNSSNFMDAWRTISRSTSKRIVMDLETNGLEPYKGNRLIGVALLVDGLPYYFPYRHGDGANLPLSTLPILLKLMNKFPVWTGWNIKFDAKFIEADNGALPAVLEDVMLAAHLANENEPNFKLKDTGRRYIDPNAADEEKELADKLRAIGLGKGNMWVLPADAVYEYAEMDVILTEKLRAFYEPNLRAWKLWELWGELNAYLKVIYKIEKRGLRLNTEAILTQIDQCVSESKRIQEEIDTAAGFHVNLNSPAQVKNMFLMFGVALENTRVETLEHLEHPAAKMILDFRRWNKAHSAYYSKFLQYAEDQADGLTVLHPNLHMTGTVSGRFSSSEPNLLALPRKGKTPQPKDYVKSAFIARPGYVLVQCDYKQAEVYLGAAYAGAKNLFKMLRAGVDVHQETADKLGIPRSVAKSLNFSMQYGIGRKRLVAYLWEMVGLRISEDEAQEYIRQYNQLHPEMKKLYYFAAERAERHGYIRLFTGRVRRYNDMIFSTAFQKASPPNTASNNLIQGGVAEMLRLASMEIDRRLAAHDVHQLLHVHDSILCEIPEGRLDLINEVAEIMTDPDLINVCTEYGPKQIATPFKVDVEIGVQTWYKLISLAEYTAQCAGAVS